MLEGPGRIPLLKPMIYGNCPGHYDVSCKLGRYAPRFENTETSVDFNLSTSQINDSLDSLNLSSRLLGVRRGCSE